MAASTSPNLLDGDPHQVLFAFSLNSVMYQINRQMEEIIQTLQDNAKDEQEAGEDSKPGMLS